MGNKFILINILFQNLIILLNQQQEVSNNQKYLKYELSPYNITLTEGFTSFPHFLTHCCAIIGGVYVVSGYLNSIVWHWKKKYCMIQAKVVTM